MLPEGGGPVVEGKAVQVAVPSRCGGERLRPKSMRQHLQGQLDEGVEVPQSDVGRAGS